MYIFLDIILYTSISLSFFFLCSWLGQLFSKDTSKRMLDLLFRTLQHFKTKVASPLGT